MRLIDNRAERVRTLKRVIYGLHHGEDPAAVKARLTALIGQCDAGEIAAMEQELMAEGVPVQEIMGMCDLHSTVVRELLVERPHAPVVAGHPVDVFRRGNAALGEKSRALRKCFADLISAADEDVGVDARPLGRCRGLFNELMDVDKHYSRKEHLLFPILERHGISGPQYRRFAGSPYPRPRCLIPCVGFVDYRTNPASVRNPERMVGSSSTASGLTVGETARLHDSVPSKPRCRRYRAPPRLRSGD